ncbi:MAG: hypothetical protein GX803_04730 [Lentisphaerae bacterium]|jgi:hypothetical protein|nr:hypothetical protein [Lentisphaerota bacterium]
MAVLALVVARAAHAQTAPRPRAEIVRVEQFTLQNQQIDYPGARVRTTDGAVPDSPGSQQIRVHWHALPPGIPPGAVLMLEVIHDRNPVIQNKILPYRTVSIGDIHSTVVFTARDIQQSGYVNAWRASVAWRGRILARTHSPTWTTASLP